MSKKLQILIVTVCVVGLSVFFGCAAFQDAITPCYIAPPVLDYIEDSNDVPLPPFKSLLPFTSIFDAERLDARMDFIHLWRQTKENLRHGFNKGINQLNIAVGRELQTTLFSPDGVVGLLLPSSMVGALSLLAGGRFIKSPREKELEKENSK